MKYRIPKFEMVRSLEPNSCIVTSICVSTDSESNSFANWSRSSGEDIMEENEEDVEESNTQTDVTHWCHVTFWPRDSNAIFEGKIAQIWRDIRSNKFVKPFENIPLLSLVTCDVAETIITGSPISVGHLFDIFTVV